MRAAADTGRALTPANVVTTACIVGVFALSVWLLFCTFSIPASASTLTALIHDADGAVHELPLSADDQLSITTDEGTNVVRVQDGAVFMEEADCDGQDCIHQGSLASPGGQIICLPHQLWIEVVANSADAGQMDVGTVAGTAPDDANALDVVSR